MTKAMRLKTLLMVLLLVLILPGAVWAQETMAVVATGEPAIEMNDDRDAVRAAVLDYVEGIYDVAPERIERSVHPALAKVGYWWSKDDGAYKEGRMTYDELVSLAGRWNQNGRVDPETAVKTVEILDMMDKTAVAKLSADWGVDYMHLAKIDGRWTIMNVIWQSYTPDAP